MAKTSDFESENSGSTPDEAAMRCDRCKHWSKEDAADYSYADVGACIKALPFWEASEWERWRREHDESDAENWRRALRPEFVDLKMFVQDGSDYRAIMLTKPDFFCAHFVKQHGDDRTDASPPTGLS